MTHGLEELEVALDIIADGGDELPWALEQLTSLGVVSDLGRYGLVWSRSRSSSGSLIIYGRSATNGLALSCSWGSELYHCGSTSRSKLIHRHKSVSTSEHYIRSS